MKRIIKCILISILIIILLAVGGGIFISIKYEKEITAFIKSELEKQLNTTINFSKIKFSLLKKIPNASFEIQNLLLSSAFENQPFDKTDTILFSENLFFELNIIDLIQKKYTLNTIEINNGKIFFYTSKNKSTFDIFKNNNASKQSKINLNLQKLVLINSHFFYKNTIKDIDFAGFFNEMTVKGKFFDKNYSMLLDGEVFLKSFSRKNIELVHAKNIVLKTKITSNKDNYEINSGELKFNKNQFNISGTFNNENYNLNVEANPVHLESIPLIIPELYQSYIKKYAGKGKLYLKASINGNLKANQNPHIETSFNIANGSFKNLNNSINLSKLSLNGQFSNGNKNSISSSSLTISEFYSVHKNSNISGTLELINFKDPYYKIDIVSNLFLEEFSEFFKLNTSEYINGEVLLNLKVNGKIEDGKNIDLETKEGDIFLKEINLYLNEYPYEFKNIRGKLTLNNKIAVDSLNFSIKKNDFSIKGELFNLFNFLTSKNQILLIEGNLKSNNIFLEDLLSYDSSTKAQDSALVLPQRLVGNLNFSINNFVYKNFKANTISGVLQYEPSRLDVKKVSFNSMNGKIETKGQLIKTSDHSLFINSINEINNININELFYSFNNFGQNVLKHHNINGLLSGKVVFSASLSEYLKVNLNSVKTQSAIDISNGELINFEPMKNFSRFIKLEELEHITFKNIKNKISIIDKTILIPQMEINTSAFNIVGSGKQFFNGNFDYRIKVHLSELLSKKAKKAKKENDEFGRIEDDEYGKINLYFSVIGNLEDYKIKYDRESAKKARKQKSEEEQKEFKKILNEEFGWFKKNAENLNPDNKEKRKFDIEWE